MGKSGKQKKHNFGPTVGQVWVEFTEHTSGGEIINPDDEWSSREPTYIDFSVTGAKLPTGNPPWEVEVVNVDEQIQPGDDIYVVVIRYSTGDTFGYTSGAWTIEAAFKDEFRAHRIKGAINKNEYLCRIGYNCWEGYFDSLQSVDVEQVKVS